MKIINALIVAAVFVSGCASVGNDMLENESESSVSQKIIEGKTTKSDIRSVFGSPSTTSFTDSGLEIWKYEHANMSADAVNFIPLVSLFGSSVSGTKKELVILFDQQGLVKRYSMSESPVTVKTGVFN